MKTKNIAILGIIGALGIQMGFAGNPDGSCSEKVSDSKMGDSNRFVSNRLPRQGLGAQDLTLSQSSSFPEFVNAETQSPAIWTDNKQAVRRDVVITEPAGAQRNSSSPYVFEGGSQDLKRAGLCRTPHQGLGAKDLVKGIEMNGLNSDRFHNRLDDRNSSYSK